MMILKATYMTVTTQIRPILSEYVRKKFKDFPGEMQALVKNLEMPTFIMPDDPAETATWTEIHIWEKKCNSYAKREEALEQNQQ